jgi:hypothetical protein
MKESYHNDMSPKPHSQINSSHPKRQKTGGGGSGDKGTDDDKPAANTSDDPKRQQRVAEYVEALQRGGVDAATARKVIDKWREAGAGGDNPNELRKLFLKQSA